MSASFPPVHLALDYCARKLMTALESGLRHREDQAFARGLTPTTALLLRWWFAGERCRTRVDNFNAGQRQAILHTVIAHELLRSDDPELLYRLACDPAHAAAQAPVIAGQPTDYASYVLRLAPGCGLRWVAQALLLWQWANHTDAHARGMDDPRFSDRLALLGADARIETRLRDALFGPADGRGHRDTARASLLRHARLFLPPALRPRIHAWLAQQMRCDDSATLRIGKIASSNDGDASLAGSSAIVLAAGIGSGLLAAHGSVARSRPDTRNLRHATLLWVDLTLTDETVATAVPAISEFPLERAIRHGVVKLPMLEPTHDLRLPQLRAKPSRKNGLRPASSPAHRRLLHAGLRALERRESGFASLDAARRPRLLVLCDTPRLLRAARRMLVDAGLDAGAIAMPGHHPPGDCRVLIHALHPLPVCADARICVIVVLRTHTAEMPLSSTLAAGLGLLWPEPDFAGVRNENRERAALGRMPGTLIDALSIIEHPQCHERYAGLLRAGLMARGDDADDASSAVGDLIASPLREHAAAFDIPLPGLHGDGFDGGDESLLAVPLRILRTRRAMPVRKSPYGHEAWSEHDSGLRRAFLECAESDPRIESHCLIDPRRHGADIREALLAQGFDAHGWPDALVRTADTVYLVVISPSCPLQSPAPGERALSHWCARANALPHTGRRRLWRPIQLQAPQFWSWKRSETPLSALLEALAETTPLARRSPSPSAIV